MWEERTEESDQLNILQESHFHRSSNPRIYILKQIMFTNVKMAVITEIMILNITVKHINCAVYTDPHFYKLIHKLS